MADPVTKADEFATDEVTLVRCQWCGIAGVPGLHRCPLRTLPEPVRPARATAPRETARARQLPQRLAPRPEDPPARRVLRFVQDLLRWHAACAQVERAAHGDASTLLGVIRALETGVVGTGNRGTKGVGHAPAHDPAPLAIDPEATARYQRLTGDDLVTADAVLADGQGDQVIAVPFGARELACTLAQRIGFRVTPLAQALRWHKKVLERDSKCALDGSQALGETRLLAVAEAWWRDLS